MKTHSIIPIFLPEYGCPKQCVFAIKKHISGTIKIPDADEIKRNNRNSSSNAFKHK